MSEVPGDDTTLANEPPAYWARLAYESVIRFIRLEQAKRGFSQPQFWILRHLSPHDLSADGLGMTLAHLRAAMTEYIRPEDDLELEAGALLARQQVRRDDAGRLWLTDDGEATRLHWRGFAPEIRALVHDGIDDSDYIVAVKVLQRLIANTSTADPI